MTVRPIIMSGPMVRATLREIEAPGTGKRTTRRGVSKATTAIDGGAWPSFIDTARIDWDSARQHGPTLEFQWTGLVANIRPRIEVGDLLWVREAWQTWSQYDDIKPSELPLPCLICYLADGGTNFKWHGMDTSCIAAGKYRNARFAPRWASRITLEVTGVRIERLRDISKPDAIAEGLVTTPVDPEIAASGCNWTYEGQTKHGSAISAFAALWDSLNGKPRKPGGADISWQANPWVVVIEFTPRLGNVDEVAP